MSNAGFVSDVCALVNTHQSVESYFQVTYIKKRIICSKLKPKKIQFSSSTVCLMYFPFKLLLAFYYYNRNNYFPYLCNDYFLDVLNSHVSVIK